MSFVPIPENKIKEGISCGCLEALVSNVGFSIEKVNTSDDYGVDYHIKKLINIKGNLSPSPIIFEIQLKGTSNWKIKDNFIIYWLRGKTYNDIVLRNITDTTRIIFVLMCLNEEKKIWCKIDENNVNFKNSLFWLKITRKRYIPKPDSKVKIRIPIKNILDENSLIKLLYDLDYE
jgi:hypothetical protein